MRRASAQKVLHRLLMKHPAATNISILAGTVRDIQPSADMTSLQSVIVRKLDGTQQPINDVALVVGRSLLAIQVHILKLVIDCTGMAQAGVKWLKRAGFSLPENLRCSYRGNLHYSTLCFTVPPKVEAMLPLPSERGALLYGNLQHVDRGSTLLVLIKTDNNTSM